MAEFATLDAQFQADTELEAAKEEDPAKRRGMLWRIKRKESAKVKLGSCAPQLSVSRVV
jgi:hypothetical protein